MKARSILLASSIILMIASGLANNQASATSGALHTAGIAITVWGVIILFREKSQEKKTASVRLK